ncbi:GNAT family N-acetyltransferase [Gloeocapsopsis dulcis]|uniref:GNAT family N-acetyltransferase n=1 Tax=Gloeocapsopsis dulcis AAB1 = 1H9 TaxID=1433147 RepID=A0A6N8G0L1_9CHRO|nr:GNAT family N-acetyltransferase [Gloeocapsopsis dulcis]MUL38873.1 GNAT family N-acetyltransferase [Gloeocapsopsis dulcis AAB1 = 1H9]WNN89306.1 GNAT family N-acetyltransferase [Gloeocapsopsis dulcis]
MTAITQAKPDDAEDIKAFYRQCGYGGGLSEKDLILIARSEAKIIGAVRLCLETDFFVLRGMQVLAPFQRQGIGKQLLQSCTEHLVDRVCYCIPWQHLRSFYQLAGFQEVSPSKVPVLLRERFNNYISRGMSVMLMCRLPAS